MIKRQLVRHLKIKWDCFSLSWNEPKSTHATHGSFAQEAHVLRKWQWTEPWTRRFISSWRSVLTSCWLRADFVLSAQRELSWVHVTEVANADVGCRCCRCCRCHRASSAITAPTCRSLTFLASSRELFHTARPDQKQTNDAEESHRKTGNEVHNPKSKIKGMIQCK